MYITVDVDPEYVTEMYLQNHGHYEIVDLIKQIDLRVADMGFTEDVLKTLIESSEADMKGSLEESDFKEYKKVCKKFLEFWDKVD